jgi:predicted nucleic acid-binding protein
VKTAVDSSVLLDVLGADAHFGERSREALRAAYDGGGLVACEVVWAEVRAHFPSDADFEEALGLLGVRFDPILPEAALEAGRRWQAHRRGTKGARERVIADFLIGAHATLQADVLLTRDRGFYRRYFQVQLLDPSQPSS